MSRHGTTDRWITPPEVFDQLHAEFDFDLDAAADEVTRRVGRWTADALHVGEWPGHRVWMNPPYGRPLKDFVFRAAIEGESKTVVSLLPLRCSAAWWHEGIMGRAAELRFVKGRVHFLDVDGVRPFRGMMQDSVVVIWRPGDTSGRVSSFIQGERT